VALLLDLTPLRRSPAYRRLYAGLALSGIGAQLATVAIGLQVYDLTQSTAAVGLVGLAALVPLVVMGLYGGALVDHYDRRTVAMVGSFVLFAASIGNALQAWLGNRHVWVLYLLVGITNAGYGVVNPARAAIYPRLLPIELLPAANALSVTAHEPHLLRRTAAGWGPRRCRRLRDGIHGRRGDVHGCAVEHLAAAGHSARGLTKR